MVARVLCVRSCVASSCSSTRRPHAASAVNTTRSSVFFSLFYLPMHMCRPYEAAHVAHTFPVLAGMVSNERARLFGYTRQTNAPAHVLLFFRWLANSGPPRSDSRQPRVKKDNENMFADATSRWKAALAVLCLFIPGKTTIRFFFFILRFHKSYFNY